MSVGGHSIGTLYFRFGPVAGHAEGCPNAAGDLWEVTRYADTRFSGEVRQTTFRFACHACGVVHFERIDGAPAGFETTHGGEVGYASRPERAAGLWLWAGPRMWYRDERGPEAFYVTCGKARPRQPADAVGIVGWHLGKRGGVRWGAGLYPTGHGTVQASAGQDWPSRRAAVAWIAAQLTEGRDGAR